MKKRFFEKIAKPEALPIFAFLIPLVIRAIPEILMGPYVVGFDNLGYYIPNTFVWLRDGLGFWNLMALAPFFYVLLMGLSSIGVPLVIFLKVISPLFLGLLGLVVYFYANKTLSWSPKKSLLAVLFGTLYFVALRVSWDMLRSELALIFLFTTLIFLKKDGSPIRNGVLLSLAMLSVVFAHQLVAVIMFAIVLATITRLYLDKKIVELRKLFICSVPAGVLFLVIVYANYLTGQFPLVSGFPGQNAEGVMALFGFASYSDLFLDTIGFLTFCYMPLLPLIVLGAKRSKINLQLKVWISWIFIMLISVIISPNVSFAVLPYRWIMLLTYPLAFYAAEGFTRFKLNVYRFGVGLILATFSICFLVLPTNFGLPYYALFPKYVPTSMLQNTVSLYDCQDTSKALQWVGNNMPSEARLLVHTAFYGWSSLTLDLDRVIPYGYNNPASVAKNLEENGLRNPLYLIWWINGSGWHGQPTVSSTFNEVFKSGDIAVFSYNSSYISNTDSEYPESIKS